MVRKDDLAIALALTGYIYIRDTYGTYYCPDTIYVRVTYLLLP